MVYVYNFNRKHAVSSLEKDFGAFNTIDVIHTYDKLFTVQSSWERADAFAIYDITTPTAPVFIKMYKTGDAPEGIIFIPASKSPINQSLIVISSENDGLVKIYKSTKL